MKTEKKKRKKKSWYEMRDGGKEERRVLQLMAYIPPNITPLMFPDMEWELSTSQLVPNYKEL